MICRDGVGQPVVPDIRGIHSTSLGWVNIIGMDAGHAKTRIYAHMYRSRTSDDGSWRAAHDLSVLIDAQDIDPVG